MKSRTGGLLAVAIALAGCLPAVPSQSPAARAALPQPACTDSVFDPPIEAVVAQAGPRNTYLTIDDRWAELARRHPGGFAGVLYVGDRQPVLMLARPREAAAAKAALAPEFPGFPTGDAEVREARWDFAQLTDWNAYLMRRRLLPPGSLTTVDKDEARNRIVLGVRDSTAIQHAERELAALGIPCRLVELKIAKPEFDWDG